MITPQQADIFLIPLLDGSFGAGQVIEASETPDNAALCLMTLMSLTRDATPAPFGLSDMIALVLLQPDHLIDGTWPIIGFEQLPQIEKVFKLRDAKRNGFENIQIHDPAIVEAFVNACHGLYPWDAFPDPTFFDTLLVRPDARPPKARMKSSFDA